MRWTESRSPVLGLLVEPFFRGIVEKWLFGIEMDKMVTNGGPQMHPQKAPLLSKDWGAPQCAILREDIVGLLWMEI